MKIMKSYRQLIPVVAIPVLIISGILVYFPHVAIQVFKIHWLGLLAALIVALGPWGKQSLAAEPQELPRYTWWGWLGQILLLQLCFSAVFLGVSTVCGQTAAVLTTPQPALFQQTMTQLLVTEGLFPWAFIALIAVSLGFYSYHHRQDAYLATTVSRLTQHPILQIIINFIGRLAILIAYGSTFCLISLLWASTATTFPIVTGFALTPILVTIILLVLSMTKIYRRNLTKSLGKEIPLVLHLFLWVVLFAVAIWLLNGFLAPVTNIPMAPPSLLTHWLNQPWILLWGIFANSWWLLWLPLLAITVARISRGYSLRAVIAAVLGLPLLISIILAVTRHTLWEIPVVTANFIAGAGLLGLLGLTLHKKAVPAFILVYLPRHDHYKFRAYRSTLVKVTQIAAIFLFIYLPGGMTLIHFLAFAAILLLLLIISTSVISLFKALS